MHYGPQPESSRPPSGISTPASESNKRLSDPPADWETRGGWAPFSSSLHSETRGEQLAPIQFGDGPPWSEDEDIQSPVVSSSRHRKSKSAAAYGSGRGRSRREAEQAGSTLRQENYENQRNSFAGREGENNERYRMNQGNGGEFDTYSSSLGLQSALAPPYNTPGQRDSHFAGMITKRSLTLTDDKGLEYDVSESESSSASSPGLAKGNSSRWSKEYSFTIASPDEEMHGKAVALFNFVSESENELPLVEGQVIWVSYRQAEGWLVAEDPKTQERGLVPEEYVRLLRDIRGGLNSLTGQIDPITSPAPESGNTPTQADHKKTFTHTPTPSNGSNGYQQPVVSTFSTSSKDLNLYPQHLLGTQAGQTPPQVVHYHGQRGSSQANTPTISTSLEGDRTTSLDAKARKIDSSNTTPVGTTLPDAKLELSPPHEQPESPASDTTDESYHDEKPIKL